MAGDLSVPSTIIASQALSYTGRTFESLKFDFFNCFSCFMPSDSHKSLKHLYDVAYAETLPESGDRKEYRV